MIVDAAADSSHEYGRNVCKGAAMLVQRHKQAQLTARALLTATESLLERTRVLRAEATRLRIEAGALRIARGTRHRLTRTRGSASAAS